MKAATATAATIAAVLAFAAGAAAQETKDTICAQGTYAPPCPKVIWCPAKRCGIGIPRADGDLEVIYSSEPKMNGKHKKPMSAGQPLSLQNLAGKVIMFEWEEGGQEAESGANLMIKDILYVIMPPPNAG
jgi:hypothetical protein